MSQDLGISPDNVSGQKPSTEGSSTADIEKYTKLLARCYQKQGQWQVAQQEVWSEETMPDILRSYYLATCYDQNWYKAWHAWAFANFQVISQHESRQEQLTPELYTVHCIPAVQGI